MISFWVWFFALCSLSVYVRDFYTMSMFHAFGRDLFWILDAALFSVRILVCFSLWFLHRYIRYALRELCVASRQATVPPMRLVNVWLSFYNRYLVSVFIPPFVRCMFLFFYSIWFYWFWFSFFSDYTHSWSCKLLIRINQACIIVHEHISICVELVVVAAVIVMNIKSVNMFSLFVFFFWFAPFRPPSAEFWWATWVKKKEEISFFLY